MLKKTITYTDFNGVERTEDFYFNLSKTELQEMELSIDGGMSAKLSSIQAAKDMKEMRNFFEFIIRKAYGDKSPDGRRLMKEDGKLAQAFIETPAYDILFQELLLGDHTLTEFLIGIVPSDVAAQVRTNLNSEN